MLSIGLSLANTIALASGGGGGTSSAILSATDHSTAIALDTSFQAHCTGTGGFQALIRANLQQANQKGHWEVTINKFASEASPAGSVGIALMDSLGNEAIPIGGNPGQVPVGFSCVITRASTTVTMYRNGAGDTSKTLSALPAVGDTMSLDYDFTAHTVHVRYKHVSGGTVDDLGTITLTSLIPAVPYAAASAYFFSDASNFDQFTFNPGNAAFAITPDTGFTYYA